MKIFLGIGIYLLLMVAGGYLSYRLRFYPLIEKLRRYLKQQKT